MKSDRGRWARSVTRHLGIRVLLYSFKFVFILNAFFCPSNNYNTRILFIVIVFSFLPNMFHHLYDTRRRRIKKGVNLVDGFFHSVIKIERRERPFGLRIFIFYSPNHLINSHESSSSSSSSFYSSHLISRYKTRYETF